MGLSEVQSRRSILDWSADLLALADALEIDRFAVIGLSAGAPYAAACGTSLGDRVSTIGLVSGVSPLEAPGAMDGMLSTNRIGYAVGRRMPWPLWRRVFALYYGDVPAHPEKLVDLDEEEASADQAVLVDSGVRPILLHTFAEAFRQGAAGPARDAWLLTRPWGFALEHVAVPVHLWQGEADVVVTPAMARHMARHLPQCQARFLPGEGHLLWVTHWEEILATVADAT